MPSYTNDDREMIGHERALWIVCEILTNMQCGAWTKDVEKLHSDATLIATALRDYNDQFEEDE